MISIFVETFAPPRMAVKGRLPSFRHLSIAMISLAITYPNILFCGKNCAMIAVEAWARWAVPNASFT